MKLWDVVVGPTEILAETAGRLWPYVGFAIAAAAVIIVVKILMGKRRK